LKGKKKEIIPAIIMIIIINIIALIIMGKKP